MRREKSADGVVNIPAKNASGFLILLAAAIMFLFLFLFVFSAQVCAEEPEDFIDEYFAELAVEREISERLNEEIRKTVREQNLMPGDLMDLLEYLERAYRMGMEKEQADLLAESMAVWDRMDLFFLTSALGEIIEKEPEKFSKALNSLLEEAEKQIEATKEENTEEEDK